MRGSARIVTTAIVALGAIGGTRLASGEEAARLAILEAQAAGRSQEALGAADAWRSADPEAAEAAGIGVLRGALLARLGRVEEARQAYDSQLDGPYDAYARLALAELEGAVGRPEEAVRLVASLLARNPPASLAPRAVDALTAGFAAERDCAEVAGAADWRVPGPLGRRIALLRADCLAVAGQTAASRQLLESLLAGQDGVDLGSTERLLALDGEAVGDRAAERLGQVLFAHRDFAAALPLLEQGALAGTPSAAWATPYAIARSLFWLERYPEAAARFQALAARSRVATDRADAFYQAGRSLELAGDRAAAASRFRECVAADPAGTWAPPCHLAILRLAWLEGREAEGLAAYRELAQRRQWAEPQGRGALFLASSDLVAGRADRARAWLDAAAATAPPSEIAYWRGRLAELQAAPEAAVTRYRQALLADPYDVFARAARHRLRLPALAAAAREAADAASQAGTRDQLLAALRLLGPDDPASPPLAAALRDAWDADPRAAAIAELAPLPPAAWDLGPLAGAGAGARLVALGLWETDLEALAGAFPAAPAASALTRAELLAGTRPREAVRLAEGLAREAPDGFPDELLAPALRRLLHPRPFRDLVEREATARRVDPLLLYALMREESRFDPGAVSPAAAHGLTQFVLPTARRVGAAIGRERVSAADLHRPEVAIALAAALLADLEGRFPGSAHVALAAYNAGEPQAELWASYCSNPEVPEYVSKIGFRQTRDYVRKVLRGWAVYEELYGTAS